MSRKLIVGDLVVLETKGKNLYMVVDVEERQFTDDEGDEVHVDVCDIMQVHPPLEKSPMTKVLGEDLVFFSREGEKGHDALLAYLDKERAVRGIKEEPDYYKYIEETKNRKDARKRKEDRIINYGAIKTIDDCLDAMNDLTDLHREFGGDRYLLIRQILVKRIKELSKTKPAIRK